jgi:hypothetical protein
LESQNLQFNGVAVWYRARCIGIALEALVPENLHLSLEMVQQIVRETRAERELSQQQIETLASVLNLTLSLQYEHHVELYSEPTFKQLSNQITTLHKALERVKSALPSAEQSSLRYYLIHLGEEYAAEKGQHPGLEPHYVSGLNDNGEEVTARDHYRSDERLDQIIDGMTQLLDWLDCTPAEMKRPSNWWNRMPHWLEDQSELIERLEKPPRHLQIDAHRRRRTEYLIGDRLPQVYEMTFNTRYGVSRPPGPGIRFVSAVLRHAEIYNDDNKPFSIETIIKYRQLQVRSSGLDNEPK